MGLKFNINSLEEKLNKIDDSSKKITKKIGNFTNKKQIEYIISFFFQLLNYEYQIKKIEYLDLINNLSYNYLLGSEWYIGEEYPFDYFFNTIDQNIKNKIYIFLFFMNTLYQKFD